MSQPQSLKYYSFKDITNYSDEVFTDDYCNDTFETWKFKASTTKGGKFDYKAKVKSESSSIDDEIKFQFPYKSYFYWFGAKRNGNLKFHIDWGQHKVKDHDFNFFTNLKTNTKFDDYQFRFGANYFGGHCESSNRIETSDCGESSVCVSSRTMVNKNPYFFGYFGTFSLDKLCFLRYDGVIGYEKDNTYLYLQHFSNTNCYKSGELQLGDIQMQGIFKKWDKKHLAVSTKRESTGNLSFQAAFQQHITDDWWVKAKINNKLDLNLATKYKINSLMNVLLSAKLELGKGTSAVNFSKFTPVPFGFTFELGI